MPPFHKPNLVTLRRQDLSQPWGFRLAGGANQGQPFHVQKVIPESIAHRSGLQEGNLLVRIGNITLKGLTHEEVQEIILRCMNTIDLFVIRNPESESTENQNPNQMNPQYSPYINETGPKSLTEHVLNRMIEKDNYYSTDFMDYSNPSSPPLQQQFFVKEREMYEYNEYSSPSQSKSPQSPIQKPPPSGRPFSPVVSPTNISYHLPEEQQWLSSQEQLRDSRVFGASPRARSSSPVPSGGQQPDGQKDIRVFGVKPRGQSPLLNGQGSRPTTATMSATPSPIQETVDRETKVKAVMSPQPFQYNKQTKITEMNVNPSDQSKDKQFYAQNKRPENWRNPGVDRPETGHPFNDRRVFANNWKKRMGGSLDSQPHWKEPLPLLKTVRPDVNQLLPSHTKRQQTYIVQTPPTERNARPPPTGTMRRRIRPVWPPPDASGRPIPKSGFDRGESPSRKYEWPPSREGSVDRENYENGIMSPRMRYSTPPPGVMWNPRGESESQSGRYTPTRRVKNSNWPPLSNATPAGRSGYRPDFVQSMPGSRRGSQALDTSDFYVYTMNNRIPQSYRAPPPSTQYFDQSYHYDTD